MLTISVPDRVVMACRGSSERSAWLSRLPRVIEELQRRWGLTLGAPFDGAEVSCGWVAPVVRADGSAAVLKLGMPDMEGEHERAGLRFWNGDPTVRLLEAADDVGAMLLERCEPGSSLRASAAEDEQDAVVAGLLRRLWRAPPVAHFRRLSAMTAFWSRHTVSQSTSWPDAGLVRAGLELFAELPANAPMAALLATDLHAGNVLRSEREPWLVIDPKPFVGDPAYESTQHLLNGLSRLERIS